MNEAGVPAPDHGVGDRERSVPPPLYEVAGAPRLSPAEEARTLVAGANTAALATLTSGGDPWASLVTFAALDDGSLALCLSRLAEHGRNLASDSRASLLVTQPLGDGDPLAGARVTLAGLAERAEDPLKRAAAREALLGAVESASAYVDFSDFMFWTLRVQRVRWVGGYGRMASASGAEYNAAMPDPVAIDAKSAIVHLNQDHGDALLVIAQTLGGYPDATAARCSGLDRRGIDLVLETQRGRAPTRVAFPHELAERSQLRGATVELTRRACAGPTVRGPVPDAGRIS
jgi:putative heme iron utilization protein